MGYGRAREKIMTKTCQHCATSFEITANDMRFYERIHVPPPTWCPGCRMVRRMCWRNERALYKRTCTATNKNIISIFSSVAPLTVYEQKYWWSDAWDPTTWGCVYDFSKPLFTQFRELLERVPLVAVFNRNQVASEYCNHVFDNKNCYLVFGSIWNEDVAYANRAAHCRDSFDLYITHKGELCYDTLYCENSSRLFFSDHCRDCLDSWFLYDCRACSHCFGCTNLRNKQYHIFNKPYDKESYEKQLARLNIGSYASLARLKEDHRKLCLKSLRRHAHMTNSLNCTGDNLYNSKNASWCFDILNGIENGKYNNWGGYNWKDSYDGLGCGLGELLYESIDSGGVEGACSRTLFTIVGYATLNAAYCYNCHNCSNLFACIGLRNKQYCILNKQYTKEEYEALIPKIIEHMNTMPYVDSKGRIYRYGEFFPPELSPFCYNETIAQEYFPLTKEQALEKGYGWKDPEERNIQITLSHDQLPDHIKDVSDDIVNHIIGCQHAGTASSAKASEATCNEQCTKGFKIIPQELAFYRKMNLPLPRLCPNCRHYARLRQRNPLKLWKRRCMCNGEIVQTTQTIQTSQTYRNTATHRHGQNPCPEEFETSYSPGRQEIVYCEACYQQEVV